MSHIHTPLTPRSSHTHSSPFHSSPLTDDCCQMLSLGSGTFEARRLAKGIRAIPSQESTCGPGDPPPCILLSLPASLSRCRYWRGLPHTVQQEWVAWQTSVEEGAAIARAVEESHTIEQDTKAAVTTMCRCTLCPSRLPFSCGSSGSPFLSLSTTRSINQSINQSITLLHNQSISINHPLLPLCHHYV